MPLVLVVSHLSQFLVLSAADMCERGLVELSVIMYRTMRGGLQCVIIAILMLKVGVYILPSAVESGTVRMAEKDRIRSSQDRIFSMESSADNVSQQYQLLIAALKACKWDHAVIFSNGNDAQSPGLVKFVLDVFYLSGIPVTHFEISAAASDIARVGQIILDSYDHLEITNFVWVDTKLESFIRKINKLIDDNSRSSLLPNRVQFIVLSPFTNIEDFQGHFENFILDNVALFFMEKDSFSVTEGYTLMWRAKRIREFQRLADLAASQREDICTIFPNTEFSLNGRHLLTLVKEYEPYVLKGMDPITGKLRFHGFEIEIADALALALNATLDFVPEPGQDDELTWTEYSNVVADASVDFGLNFWISNSVFNYNHTLSFPVIYSNMIGVYLEEEYIEYYTHFRLFQPEVFLCILGAMIFTMALYIIIAKITLEANLDFGGGNDNDVGLRTVTENRAIILTKHNQFPDVGNGIRCAENKGLGQITAQQQHVMHRKRSNSSEIGIYHLEPKNFEVDQGNTFESKPVDDELQTFCSQFLTENTSPCLSSKVAIAANNPCICRLTELVTDIFFRLLGSVFAQGILPRPKRFSARLLVWSWCLMLVILSAGYTGSMTAFLVRDEGYVPFTTFQEMMDGGEYTWGIEEGNSLFGVMEKAKNGTTLRRLYEGIMRFREKDPRVISTYDVLFSKVLSGKFVAIVYQTRFEILTRFKPHSKFRVLKEGLLPTGNAMIFPRKSELRDLISKHLMHMTDCGLIAALQANIRGNATNVYSEDSDNPHKRSLGITYLLGTFYVCGGGVLLALTVMLMECVVVWVISCNLAQ